MEFLENPHGFVHVSMGQRNFNGEPTFQICGFGTDSVPVPMGQTRSERPALALQASALEMQAWGGHGGISRAGGLFVDFSIFTKQPGFVFFQPHFHMISLRPHISLMPKVMGSRRRPQGQRWMARCLHEGLGPISAASFRGGGFRSPAMVTSPGKVRQARVEKLTRKFELEKWGPQLSDQSGCKICSV